MVDLFDYIFTCSSCNEQYETEGRRSVDSAYVAPLKWSVEGDKITMSCGYEEQVCEYCLSHNLTPEQIMNSPWIQHYLKKEAQELYDEDMYLDAPFAFDLTPEQCLNEAIKLTKQAKAAKLQKQVKEVTQTLKDLASNPDCDLEALKKEVRSILSI